VVRTGFRWGEVRERDDLEDVNIDWRIILKWIFKQCDGGGVDWIWLRIGKVGGSL
jgi:hypothetical protein